MGNEIHTGLGVIWSSGNIAIVVEMVLIIMQQVLIGFLLKGLLNMKDVLEKVNTTLAVLLERLNNHD